MKLDDDPSSYDRGEHAKLWLILHLDAIPGLGASLGIHDANELFDLSDGELVRLARRGWDETERRHQAGDLWVDLIRAELLGGPEEREKRRREIERLAAEWGLDDDEDDDDHP